MSAPHRVASLLATALLLSLTSLTEAQVSPFWQGLGGSETGAGLSATPAGKNPYSPSVTIGADGRPVVTYVEPMTGVSDVPLGAAGNFAILAGDSISSTGASVVRGAAGTKADIGAGTAVSGFIGVSPGGLGTVDGRVLLAPNATVTTALADVSTAMANVASRTGATSLGGGNIGGQTLGPGLYDDFTSISSGNLTLDASNNPNAVWVFRATTDFTVASDHSVFLINGAQAANVFWIVNGTATIGLNSRFKGIIVAADSITLASDVMLQGRALSRTGSVTLDSGAVVKPPIGAGAIGAIVVKRWTGTAWELLNGAGGIGTGFAPQIRISPDGNHYYVAWLQDEGSAGVQVHLLRCPTIGTPTWTQLGGSNSAGGLTNLPADVTTPITGNSVGAFSLVVGADNNPVVAFEAEAQTGITVPNPGIADGELQVYVRRYNGSNAWPYLGSDPATGGGASDALSFLVDNNNNRAFHFAASPSLAVQDDGTLVLAFQYGTFYTIAPPAGFIGGNTEIFAKKFLSGGLAWTALGPAVPTSDDFGAGRGGAGGISNNGLTSRAPSLAIGGNQIWVTWLEDNDVFARHWNGASWVEASGSGSGNGISQPEFFNGDPAVAVDALGRPIVAWSAQDPEALGQVFVLRDGAGAFAEMGANSASGAGISNSVIAATAPIVAAAPTSAGGPAVVWLDQQAQVGTSQVFLRQYSAYTLTVAVAGDAGGSSVSSAPAGIACPGDCSELYPGGTVVALTPVAGPNQQFISWSGACTGGGACNVSMSADRTVTATFADTFTVSVSVTGGAGSTVTSTPAGISCPGTCSAIFPSPQVVVLTPGAGPNQRFTAWGDDCSGAGACSVTVTTNRAVSATFADTAPLTVTLSGATGGSSVSSTPAGIVCPTTCVAPFLTTEAVSLVATAGTNQRFIGWSGGGCSGTSTCEVPMTSAQSVTATFAVSFTLNVTRSGASAGSSVTSTPAGIACPGTCSASFLSTETISLVATAGANQRFISWVGGGCSGNTTCNVPMTSTQNVTAIFSNTAVLTVTVDGNTAGSSVTSTPAGIDCPGTCSASFLTSQTVSLVATAGPSQRLVSWSGGGCSGAAACSVPMTTAQSITATFADTSFGLTITKTGSGAALGTVSGPGINCGSGCALPFATGTVVPLSIGALPAGTLFGGWGGACASRGTLPTCSVNVTGNTSVTADFPQRRQSLTVQTATGSAAGFVGSTPSGIDCGNFGAHGDCTEVYDYGTSIQLQATVVPGITFVRWTGNSPCSAVGQATNPNCSFSIQGNVTAIASYRASTLVTLTKTGLGQGTVTATGTLSPATVNCGPTCTAPVLFTALDANPVTLTATPAVGSRFVEFTAGFDCESNSSPCTFIPSGTTDTVRVRFEPQDFSLRVTRVQDGNVVSVPSGAINCGLAGGNCTEDITFNTQVSLVATPNADAVFVRWTGTVCNGSTNPTCTFAVPASQITLTPVYRARTSITLVKAGNGSGTVTSLPAGINCGTDCTEAFFDNVAVKLTATATLGSTFVGFSDACVSSTTTCAFVPGAGGLGTQTVTAQFVLNQLALSVASRPDGNVTSTTPAGVIDCGATGTLCTTVAPINYSAPVTLVAAPIPGLTFNKWAGDAVCLNKLTASCSFTMPNRAVSVVPTYKASTLVTIVKTGNGLGQVASLPGGIACLPNQTSGATCSEAFADGVTVKLTATPSVGSTFNGFTGAGLTCLAPTSPTTCTFVPPGNGNQSINAGFTLQSRAVNVTVNGDGNVTSGLTTCTVDNDPCPFSGEFGASIVFTAHPGAGNALLSQVGCTSVTPTTCTVKLDQAAGTKNVTVTFSSLLTATRSGNGAGTVTSTPTGISCGADCSQPYAPSTMVTLNRVPAAGSILGPWGGDCAFRGTNASCTVAMTQNRGVDANFSLPQLLTVTKTGTGLGSVISGPVGITCGADCTQIYPLGTQVTLTATAANGSVFTGFGPADCVSRFGSSCLVSMTANLSVTATFTAASPGGPVNLRTSANFAVLAGSTIANVGATVVSAPGAPMTDLGVSPGTTVTGFSAIAPGGPGIVDGTILVAPDATVAQAKADLNTAFNDLAGRATAPIATAGDLGGQTLSPGLYKSTSILAITSGDLTLDAGGDSSAVWIFQIADTLTVGAGRQVFLINGASAANIFWQVGTSATLDAASALRGSILADQSITLNNGAVLEGRALARAGAVSLDTNLVTTP